MAMQFAPGRPYQALSPSVAQATIVLELSKTALGTRASLGKQHPVQALSTKSQVSLMEDE